MCEHHGDDETCGLCEAPPQLAVLGGEADPQAAFETAASSAPELSHIAGILSGNTWSSASLTFAFTTSASQYTSSDAPNAERSTFSQLSEGGKAIFRDAIGQWEDVSGLDLIEASVPGSADIRIAGSKAPSTAWAYYPNEGWGGGGDIWANTGYIQAYKKAAGDPSGAIGTYAYATALHEVGHALGLEHPHDGTQLSAAYDSVEYTVMSYKSYVGQSGGGYTNETHGYAQSLMMLDIAAIQSIYGADHSTRSGDTTYSFDPATGEMKIDGASVATPEQNRIFRTLWDGDGFDTLNLALYTSDIRVDLNPGEATDLDVGGLSQKARLGYNSGGWVYASANIYMSLLHEGDARSLIEAAVCGSGDDILIGNAGDNLLCGGLGLDTYTLGAGDDVVRGRLGELLGDTITDFGLGDRVVALDLGAGQSIDVGADGVIRLIDASGLDEPGEDAGSDPRIVRLTDTRDTYVSNAGEGMIVLGLSDRDTISTGTGSDRLVGGSGSDTLQSAGGADTLEGGEGADRLDGGKGDDVLVGGNHEDVARGRDGRDILYGDEGADQLWGDDGRDSLLGGGGDDTLLAGRGDDVLFGGSGRDRLTADIGRDLLHGGEGADILTGGQGADTYVFHSDHKGQDTIEQFEFGLDLIEIDGFAGRFADLLFTESRKDLTIEFGSGSVLVQKAGSADFDEADFVFFTDDHADRELPSTPLADIALAGTTASARTIHLTDSADKIALASLEAGKRLKLMDGNDRASAGAGDDTIDGGAGHDRIGGARGDDLIIGGSGEDDLGGGGGRDVFRFRVSDGTAGETRTDIIRDFAWKHDRVQLVGFDDTMLDDLAFTFSGKKAQIVVDDVQTIVFANLRDHDVFHAHNLIDFT